MLFWIQVQTNFLTRTHKIAIMNWNENELAFFTLLRAGLWNQESKHFPFPNAAFPRVFLLAEEQSVVGLIAAGIEWFSVQDLNFKIPKEDALQFIGRTVQLEKTNQAMNQFIVTLAGRMQEAGIYALLVKGQGIAQCYSKPLWRSCGDVDLLLDKTNYTKAINFLAPMAQSIDEEDPLRLHYGMTIGRWVVELHGTLRSGLSSRIDNEIDAIQHKTFEENHVRIWSHRNQTVYLPSPDNDIIFVFSHILQHFFKGGIGLRQICDLCRLLWTFRSDININLLEQRLRKMRLISEWRTFAALAVDYLGMPAEAMPLYAQDRKWSKKGYKVLSLIIETGNFGHNRDMSYIKKNTYVYRKTKSFAYLLKDSTRRITIFPIDSIRVLVKKLLFGVNMIIKGK